MNSGQQFGSENSNTVLKWPWQQQQQDSAVPSFGTMKSVKQLFPDKEEDLMGSY